MTLLTGYGTSDFIPLVSYTHYQYNYLSLLGMRIFLSHGMFEDYTYFKIIYKFLNTICEVLNFVDVFSLCLHLLNTISIVKYICPLFQVFPNKNWAKCVMITIYYELYNFIVELLGKSSHLFIAYTWWII